MPKQVIVLLTEGFEEVEAVTPIGYLRRLGIEVTIAAVGAKSADGENLLIKSSRGIRVAADTTLETLAKTGKLDPASWDAVVVPGGLPGADNLASSAQTGAFLTAMSSAGKVVAAICASPARVLAPLGILTGKAFTCAPGEESKVPAGAEWKQDRVVVDGNIITSRSAGTAGEFACAVAAKLAGQAEAEKLAEKLLLLR